MNKLRRVESKPGEGGASFVYWCPGCEHYHGVWTVEPNPMTKALWTFNGSLERPTFNPSLLINYSEKNGVCHCFIRDGRIEFLGDCTHALAGKVVEMEDEK